MHVINVDEIEYYLVETGYPLGKVRLVEEARKLGAKKDIISLLEQLPEKRYDGRTEVKSQLNRIIQQQRETGPR